MRVVARAVVGVGAGGVGGSSLRTLHAGVAGAVTRGGRATLGRPADRGIVVARAT